MEFSHALIARSVVSCSQSLAFLVALPLAHSGDGRTLFVVRGGGAPRAGEIPEPTSDPVGAEPALDFLGGRM